MGNIKAERACLSEFYHYSRRHRRYFTIFIFLYLLSPLQWRKLKMFRFGFCLLQYVDDILDGDRACSSPELLAQAAISEIWSGKYSNTRYGILAEAFFTCARQCSIDTAELKDEVVKLINVMIDDHTRRSLSSILQKHQLKLQFHKTFSGSINVAMIIWQSDIRAGDVPELINCFAWCSCIRDLDEDCEKGLINIPAEILSTSMPLDLQRFKQEQRFSRWIQDEFTVARRTLNNTTIELEQLKGRKGVTLLHIFHRSMNKFYHNYREKHPQLFEQR